MPSNHLFFNHEVENGVTYPALTYVKYIKKCWW